MPDARSAGIRICRLIRRFLPAVPALVLCCHSYASGRPEPAGFHGPPAASGIGSTGVVYYLSESGNDFNDGLSESRPWRTPSRLASASLAPGDIVLFERGGTYRLSGETSDGLKTVSGTPSAWVLYGAWGDGDLPVLLGSVDLSDTGKWTGIGNGIWKTVESLPADVGQIYLDSDAEIGRKKWVEADLLSPGDFLSDEAGHLLVFFEGGPGDHQSIEAALTRHIVNHHRTGYAVFENLHLKYGGAHGFGGAGAHHIIIRNCEFSFIGGGLLPGLTEDRGSPVRYGNAVEFWGSAGDILVEGNNIHDIYDTALTNQNHGAVVTQTNIYYMNNVIRDCGLASFELWVRPASSVVSHVYFLHNSSLNPGHGWGAERPQTNSFHVASFSSSARTDNVVISGNIFATTLDPGREGESLLYFDSNPPDTEGRIILSRNLWYSVVKDGAGP